MSVLWYIAIMIAAGMLCGRLAKLVKLPNITGYLVAGLLIGPYLLNLLSSETAASLDVISEVALAFIAFSVGSEFKLSYIKRVGATPIVIACAEALFAMLFVTGGMLAIGKDLAFSVMIGAIASATAPAATIMVVRQYKAKGPLTDTLLTVVALDDAAALMLFGIATAIAGQLTGGGGENVFLAILKPLYEIALALLLGGVLGFLIKLPLRFFKKQGNRLCILIATVFLASALASFLNISELLVCMALGAVFTNVSDQAGDVMKISDAFTPPILILFFVLSGSELNLAILPSIGLVGICYVVMRVIGKILGAYMGAKVMKAPKQVARNLGFALVPQAGVAIGLSLLATQMMPQYGAEIRAVILCGTFIYELFGPVLAKVSLVKAGEIEKSGKSRKKELKSSSEDK